MTGELRMAWGATVDEGQTLGRVPVPKTRATGRRALALLAIAEWLMLPPLADLQVYGDGSFEGCVAMMACRGG